MSFAERNRLNKVVEDIAALQTMVGELVGRVGVLEARAATQEAAIADLSSRVARLDRGQLWVESSVSADPRGQVEAAIATDRMSKARAAKAAKRDDSAA